MNEEVQKFYKALSNTVRFAVFMHVVDHSEGFAPVHKDITCVGEISEAIGAPQPTVSNHLKVLESTGLIKSIKVGTKSYQYVRKEAAKKLLEHTTYLASMASKNPY